MQDYEIGLVGQARVIAVDGSMAEAEVTSLTSDYVPQVNDMVTTGGQRGRLWQQGGLSDVGVPTHEE